MIIKGEPNIPCCNFLTNDSQQKNRKNEDWCMKRFCDNAQTCLQRVKGRRGGYGSMKLVDLNDDMRSMLQVLQKAAALYDEFKKVSKDFNISENIDAGIDEFEDTLSVISGTSGFSSGSQMLPRKDYDDENCDNQNTDIVEKRINYLARLDVPSQLFTTNNFDWAAIMYSKVLEELCDSQGDYSALKEFHDALQHRLDQNIIPYSQRIHRLVVDLSKQGSRFSRATIVIEKQLKYDFTLNDNETQLVLNKLEDQAYQMENEKDTDEDSMAEDFSDYTKNDIFRKSKKNYEINSAGVSKKWLLEQYQNLGAKLVMQLDNKLIRIEGVFTLTGSVFRSVMMNLLQYAEQGAEEKDRNQHWFRNNFQIGTPFLLKRKLFPSKNIFLLFPLFFELSELRFRHDFPCFLLFPKLFSTNDFGNLGDFISKQGVQQQRRQRARRADRRR